MNARKLSVFLVLLTVLSLFTTMTVSARSLADNTAPFVTDVTRLTGPVFIGITIVFPSGVPSPISGGTMGGAWFQCSTGDNPNTLYCWGHTIGDYPATLNIISGSNEISVTVPPPPGLPHNNKTKCPKDECCGNDC